LQGAAAPGGICISGSVYDQIRNKLTLGFESLGERRFKNIPQPVRAFTIAGSDEYGELLPSKNASGRTGLLVTIAALLLLVLAGGYWAYSDYRQSLHIYASPKVIETVPAAAGPSATPTPANAKNAPASAAPSDAKTAVAPAAASPQAPAPEVSELSRLMRSEELSSNKCSDGSGDLEETGRACAERDRLVDELSNRGWCNSSQAGNGKWQRCAR
jgi:hypothetical protein